MDPEYFTRIILVNPAFSDESNRSITRNATERKDTNSNTSTTLSQSCRVRSQRSHLGAKASCCITRLGEGIELIDGRPKLILVADRSEYKPGRQLEYLDHKLAKDNEDGKKLNKAEKNAQRKRAGKGSSLEYVLTN